MFTLITLPSLSTSLRLVYPLAMMNKGITGFTNQGDAVGTAYLVKEFNGRYLGLCHIK